MARTHPLLVFLLLSLSTIAFCCPSVCRECYGSTQYCLVCHNGYYRISGACFSCPQNCLTCSSVWTCYTCVEGYHLSSGQCLENQKHEDKSISMMVLLAVIGIPIFVLMAVCLIGYLCRRRGTIAQQQPQQEGESNARLPDLLSNPVNPIKWINSNPEDGRPRSLEQECTICLENKVDSLTSCGHVFHANCLKAWMRKNHNCPLCRANPFPIKVYCQQCNQNHAQMELRQLQRKTKARKNSICSACSVRKL